MRARPWLFFLSACLFAPGFGHAQDSSAFYDALSARSVGPTTMGGRIADIAVYTPDPRIYYVASASGGVWKTTNAGMTYSPLFQQQSCMSLGSIAVGANNPDLVWVGSGEASSRNSCSWGDGVYKSVDGGTTWTNMGLPKSCHIGTIVIDPKKPDTVFVGALGNLWAAGGERGLYKTTDGGKTWRNVLPTDENTGVIKIVQNPKNNKELLAATWQRRRFPYNFQSGGPGSGLWKSTDGGEHWRKITKGLPNGPLGRIGMDYFQPNPREVVMTVERPPSGNIAENQSGEASGGVFRSHDGGESWTRVNIVNPRPFYFSIPRFDQQDMNTIWVPGVELLVSRDGGQTMRVMDNDVHSDYHAFWVNPKDPQHIICGVDGGVYVTRDKGVTWEMHDRMAIGQFYAIHFDMRKPYWVYGGLQDNGSWGIPTQTARGVIGPWDSSSLSGGDGFHVQVDPNDYRWVFSESQGGAVQRRNQATGQGGGGGPTGKDLRFNWSTPIVLSPWNGSVVYVGSNKLHRSMNRGASWEVISPDLTTNDPAKQRVGEGSVSPESTSAEVHCTIITIGESPREAGVLWVGTDDGNVQLSKDNGATWINVTPKPETGLPAGTWVSRVTPSRMNAGRCYATFDNHRRGDFKPYLMKTEDYGQTWTPLQTGLAPNESCYVIKEGLQNPNLLILGTEMGMYFSLNRGETWSKFKSNFPSVAVHDVAIHPRDQDLVVGTHGRSIWTVNISALEALTTDNLSRSAFLCPPAPAYLLGPARNSAQDVTHFQIANSQPGTRIFFYLKSAPKTKPSVSLQTADGKAVATQEGEMKAGLQSLQFSSRGWTEGTYRVVLKVGDNEYTSSLKVEDISENIQQTR